jgi:hypothetical protein
VVTLAQSAEIGFISALRAPISPQRCDLACRVSAQGRSPKTKRRTATLTVPNRAARIRLMVGRSARARLIRTLRTRRYVVLRVKVSVSAAAGGPARSYTRKLKVKRAKALRRR